jgi:hypothetical protein
MKHSTINLARLALFALTAGLQLGCENPVPDNPSYMYDVKPIIDARCVRCHGAGGTLNADPYIEQKDPAKPRKPAVFKLDTYESVLGAKSLITPTEQAPGYLRTDDETMVMPPPPSPRLTDWEIEVIEKWLMNPRP